MRSRELLVGLVANRRVIDGVGRDTLRIKYITAVLNIANCTPVMIPTINETDSPAACADEAIRVIAKRMDVVMLTGDESNVQPRLYGEDHRNDDADPHRDYVALGLVKACLETKTPILGICRGLQEINVAFGGTLVPDLAARGLLHTEDRSLPRDDQYRPIHTVRLTDGGLLAGWYGRSALKVNSLHNQAIQRLGNGLDVEAVSDDGLIEAISYRKNDNLILALQWHPEWHADNEDDSRALFLAFVNAVSNRKWGGTS